MPSRLKEAKALKKFDISKVAIRKSLAVQQTPVAS
jgi:hypothetical protein